MPCNVPVLAVECCKNRAILRQIQRSLEILTANDQHMVHRYFHTEVLSQRHVFTQAFTHTHAFTQGWFYAQIPSCAGVFTQGCFYTKKSFYTQTRGHFYTQMPLHSDSFTEECFYTHVHLHGVSFDTLVFTHRRFYIKYSHADMFFTQKKHVYKGVFLDTYTFTKRIFARILLRTDAFTYRCLYTRTHLGRGTLTWVRLESTTWGRVQAMWESKRCF